MEIPISCGGEFTNFVNQIVRRRICNLMIKPRDREDE
jgi:hypothetical protein